MIEFIIFGLFILIFKLFFKLCYLCYWINYNLEESYNFVFMGCLNIKRCVVMCI